MYEFFTSLFYYKEIVFHLIILKFQNIFSIIGRFLKFFRYFSKYLIFFLNFN
jgi:hypothetical protein